MLLWLGHGCSKSNVLRTRMLLWLGHGCSHGHGCSKSTVFRTRMLLWLRRAYGLAMNAEGFTPCVVAAAFLSLPKVLFVPHRRVPMGLGGNAFFARLQAVGASHKDSSNCNPHPLRVELSKSFGFRVSLDRSLTSWGIVKIMVPFWVTIIIRGLIRGLI